MSNFVPSFCPRALDHRQTANEVKPIPTNIGRKSLWKVIIYISQLESDRVSVSLYLLHPAKDKRDIRSSLTSIKTDNWSLFTIAELGHFSHNIRSNENVLLWQNYKMFLHCGSASHQLGLNIPNIIMNAIR